MAVTLQVSDVRAEIHRSAGGRQGAGAASTALLGRLFHEVFADLVGADARKNFHAAVDEAENSLDEWRAVLVNHAYQRLIGPRLRAQARTARWRSSASGRKNTSDCSPPRNSPTCRSGCAI